MSTKDDNEEIVRRAKDVPIYDKRYSKKWVEDFVVKVLWVVGLGILAVVGKILLNGLPLVGK